MLEIKLYFKHIKIKDIPRDDIVKYGYEIVYSYENLEYTLNQPGRPSGEYNLRSKEGILKAIRSIMKDLKIPKSLDNEIMWMVYVCLLIDKYTSQYGRLTNELQGYIDEIYRIAPERIWDIRSLVHYRVLLDNFYTRSTWDSSPLIGILEQSTFTFKLFKVNFNLPTIFRKNQLNFLLFLALLSVLLFVTSALIVIPAFQSILGLLIYGIIYYYTSLNIKAFSDFYRGYYLTPEKREKYTTIFKNQRLIGRIGIVSWGIFIALIPFRFVELTEIHLFNLIFYSIILFASLPIFHNKFLSLNDIKLDELTPPKRITYGGGGTSSSTRSVVKSSDSGSQHGAKPDILRDNPFEPIMPELIELRDTRRRNVQHIEQIASELKNELGL